MKKIYVLFLLLLSLFYTENVMAYDFCVDNIYYNVLSIEDLTAEVTFGETGYEGKVIIPSTVSYKGRDLSIRSIGRAAFSDCNITEIELPKSIEKIDEYAFADCRFLKSFSVKSSVLIIGSGAFSNCKALKSFIVEDSEEVLVFEDYSVLPEFQVFSYFYMGRNIQAHYKGNKRYHVSIEELTLGKNITENIDNYFLLDKETKIIKCLREEPSIINKFENNIYVNCELIVPQGSLSAYKSAESWKNFWNIHEEGSTPEERNTCNKPTIEYIEGKLCISSSTPDSKCYYSITDNDIVSNNFVDGDIDLSATYTITAYATAEGYERSSFSTATLCWIESSFETDGIETPLTSRKAAIIAAENGMVSVSGLDEGCLVQSFSIDGRIIDRSVAKDGIATLNAEQCAIIKVADKSVKIVEHK